MDLQSSLSTFLCGVAGYFVGGLLTSNSTLLVYFVLIGLVVYILTQRYSFMFHSKQLSDESDQHNFSHDEDELDDDEETRNNYIKNKYKKHRAESS